MKTVPCEQAVTVCKSVNLGASDIPLDLSYEFQLELLDSKEK